MVNYRIVKSDELYHHGIKGQKWGVRRFQNADGSLTSKGQKRYNGKTLKEFGKEYHSEYDRLKRSFHTSNSKELKEANKLYQEADKLEKQASDFYKEVHKDGKYHFDADDGGGGMTAADRKAGKKYWSFYEKAEDKNNEADGKVYEYINRNLINKYGKETIDSFLKDDKARIDKAMKNFDNIGKYLLLPASAVALVGTMAYGIKKDLGK